MESSGDTWVFWILGPVFLALGVWLFVYGRRRSAMIRRFARRHGLSYEERAPDSLAEELTETFRLEIPFVRAFMAIRDLSGDGRVRLFKCMELLDLDPWGSPQSSHFGRLPVIFAVHAGHAHWSLYGPDGRRMESRVPDRFSDPDASREIEAVLAEHQPEHRLSITLARRRGIAYLQPRVYGSEDEKDLAYLLELGRRLADRFGDEASRDDPTAALTAE